VIRAHTHAGLTDAPAGLQPVSSVDDPVLASGHLADRDGWQRSAILKHLDELLDVVLLDALRVAGDQADLDECFHEGSAADRVAVSD